MHHSTDHLNELFSQTFQADQPVYLFGYGSLLWKVDFEFESKLFGYIRGFKRQFWVLSDDHRGTPENLGRTVTLVRESTEPPSCVYGLAYKISAENARKTFEHLNFREKCGYTMIQVDFVPTYDFTERGTSDAAREPIKCICYYADATNHYFSPSRDLEAMARQIVTSAGPSGTNREYLYNFCEALRALIATSKPADGESSILSNDEHIFELEKLVRSLDRPTG